MEGRGDAGGGRMMTVLPLMQNDGWNLGYLREND